MKPSDTIEKVWVWDVAILTWEIRRYRSGIAGLLTVNAHRGLKVILDTLYGTDNSQILADRWARREPEAIKYVDNLLKSAELTMGDVTAQTLSLKISDIERLDGMVTRAEIRRNSMLREIERHRATLSTMLRKAVDIIEDGEFREIVAPDAA